MSDPEIVNLSDRFDRLEAQLNERHDTDTRRHEERHGEVMRRITAVEVQTTSTNGRVRDLEIKDAVRAQLELQEQSYETRFRREAETRGNRVRGWWMLVFAAGLGIAGTLALTIFRFVQVN